LWSAISGGGLKTEFDDRMKILHIHDSDGEARGAGSHIAMNRLYHGLKEAGWESSILCRSRTVESPDFYEIKRNFPMRVLEALLNRAAIALGMNEIAYIYSFNIARHPEFKSADVVHLHSIHGSYFSYLALAHLSRKKPMLFTMHDMWPFTGHCTVSADCERWKTGCGKCPYPNEYPSIRRDNTRLEWKLKNRIYKRSRLTIATVSQDQTEKVKQSMLNHLPTRMIHHGIDTEMFNPLDPLACRKQLGLPADKHVLMFGAADITRHGKGMDLLLRALQNIPDSEKENLVLLTFGKGAHASLDAIGISAVHLGYVEGDREKAVAYAAADLFVMPSRGESFGLVALESMACGTPVVAHRVGGLTDLVRPEHTGLLAEPENVDELCAAIVRLLQDTVLRDRMGKECRAVAVKEFSMKRCVQEHMALYEEMAGR